MIDPGAATRAAVTTTTDARSIATFKATEERIESFAVIPGKTTGPKQIDTQSTDYVLVRTLPADVDIADLEPTWENVHEKVLAAWRAMAHVWTNG